MDTLLEAGIELPETHPFSLLRKAMSSQPDLREEIRLAMQAVLDRLNPSDRGTRFLTGGAYEWILAVASWAVGVQVLPGGHSEDSFDLMEYRNGLRGLWSVKSFTTRKLSGEIRIVNKLGPGNATFDKPTLFISPELPGLTYLDPKLAPNYALRVTQDDEALKINGKLIKQFAKDNPGCVAEFTAPVNVGNGKESPQLDIVSNILTSGTYMKLGPIMTKIKKMTVTAQFLKKQYQSGLLDESTFESMLKNLENET
jgi:hypothetical protein